jgi:hypothetical protein
MDDIFKTIHAVHLETVIWQKEAHYFLKKKQEQRPGKYKDEKHVVESVTKPKVQKDVKIMGQS